MRIMLTLALCGASHLASLAQPHGKRATSATDPATVCHARDAWAQDLRQGRLSFLTVREALNRLRDDAAITQTVRDAMIDAQMGMLYWRRFPDQWRASQKSRLTTSKTMSDRQVELLSLLHRLVPSAEWYDDMDDQRPSGVPCAMMGVDIEEGLYDEDLQQFDTAHLAFLNLMGGAWAYDLEDHLINQRGFRHPFPQVKDLSRWYVDVEVFRDHCQAKPDRRWRWVADAVCVAGRCTDNNFLDWTMENYSSFDEFVTGCGWTSKGVRRLISEAKVAQRLLNGFSRACDWLNREPERWPEVFKVFDASWRQHKRQLWSSALGDSEHSEGGEDATGRDDDP